MLSRKEIEQIETDERSVFSIGIAIRAESPEREVTSRWPNVDTPHVLEAIIFLVQLLYI